MNAAGGVFLGRVVTAPPSSTTSGFNLTPGTTPGSPLNGDLWVTSSSIFARINGATVDLIGAPCAGCALTGAANTFTASPQTVQGLTTTQPGWYAQLTGDTSARARVGLNSTDVPSLAFGSGSAVRDTFLERAGAATFRFGGPDVATPVAQALGVQNVVAGTSNTAGAALTISGSRGTGTGIGGPIIFQLAPAGASGTAQNVLVNSLTLSSSGGAAFGIPVAIGGASLGGNALAVTGLSALGQFVIGTGTNADAFTVHGQQNFYFPNLASDPGCFCNTFVGNGGANLTHSVVNTTAPGVSSFPVTVTITIASPAVVTQTGSSYAAGTPVAFTNSGGSLPTGITSGQTYYVTNDSNRTTNTYAFSDTLAHALAGTGQINTTGTQSGTQSGYTTMLEGRYNGSLGQQALPAITNGAYNWAGGFETMFNCTSCSWSTGWGEAVLFSNVNGNADTGLGWKACLSTIDSNETCLGSGSMISYVGSSGGTGNNVAVGAQSLSGTAGATFFNVTGTGYGVGGALFNGHDLVLSGTSAASSATSMANGVVIGSGSAPNAVSTTASLIIGDHTGGGLVGGSGLTIIGGGQNSLPSTLTNEIRISDGTGVLGYRRDSSGNVYLSDSAPNRNIYNYYSTSTNNAGTMADGSGAWHVFTGLTGTSNWLNVYPDGSTTLGAPTGANKGAGTLNTVGGIFQNNVPVTLTIASGATAMGTSAIGSGACATAVTATATGVATTDTVTASFNGDPTAVTGYVPLTSGMLSVIAYPTSGNVNFKVCNNTSSSITPGALTLNWRVAR